MNPTNAKTSVAVVRRNLWSAMLPAVLMIYFGFFVLAEPTGSDLFSLSGKVFYHTLRVGGLLMAGITGWCAVGQRHALLADAVVSIVIGVLLILTGAGMFLDGGGGMQSILNVVFGIMFISSGMSNGRTYADLKSSHDKKPVSARYGTEKTVGAPLVVEPPSMKEVPTAAPLSEAGTIAPKLEPASDGTDSSEGVRDPDHDSEKDAAADESDTVRSEASPEGDISTPTPPPLSDSGGFLASFADDGPPPRP